MTDKTSKYRIETHHEYEDSIDYKEGHFSESGDVDWITSELENGNTWAWCVVRVSLVFAYLDIQLDEYLSGCSYEDEYAFKTGGYYEDMVNTNKQKIIDAYNSIK